MLTKASTIRYADYPANPQQAAQRAADELMAPTDSYDITQVRHPDYLENECDVTLYRDAWIGGKKFIDKYTSSYSTRENPNDLLERKKATPCPAVSKGVVNKIKNAIYQRFNEISRKNGPKNYQDACNGDKWGVDKLGSSMNTFIGKHVLPELVAMGKVGCWIDKKQLPKNHSALDEISAQPYLYTYCREDILAWVEDESSEPNQFSSLLLREYYISKDKFGLPLQKCCRYKFARIQDGYVVISYYDHLGRSIDVNNNVSETRYELDKMKVIPFVIFELTESLLTDIASYQVALLNLGSTDMDYALKSNFPFYVEQRDGSSNKELYKQGTTNSYLQDAAIVNPTRRVDKVAEEIVVGATVGRTYSKDLNEPNFIHPSPEPLVVSMQKQERLEAQIDKIVNSSLSNISATSVDINPDDAKQGMEGGLNNIGMELEHGEKRILSIWSMYENYKETGTVSYPKKYSLKNDKQRLEEAEKLLELKSKIPSLKFQKVTAKQAALVLHGDKISSKEMQDIENEIETTQAMTCDVEEIAKDHEGGLVGDQLASQLRGYPKDEWKVAQTDMAKRLALVQASQSPDGFKGGARGVNDQSVAPKLDAKLEKKDSTTSDTGLHDDNKQRGDGK